VNAPENITAAITVDYDEMPYLSNAYGYCAPGNLRAMAHLFGVGSVPLERARVLELGSAAGGNIMPFAAAYPDAHVVGVDLSQVQIDAGRAQAEAAGLKNVHLHAMSLTDIDASFGKFDYIIAHGVFSWVPPDVRLALLRVCKENLSENGLAMISYNTYPGWKLKEIMRDAMQIAALGADTPHEAVAQARSMQDMFLNGSAPGSLTFGPMHQLASVMSAYSDHYVAHEFLERMNAPCYFVEFAAVAEDAGLAYIGDAEPKTDMAIAYGLQVRLTNNLLTLGKPRSTRLQYLDMATGQSFRRSILTHGSQAANVGDIDLARFADLHFASDMKRAASPENTNEVRYEKGRHIIGVQGNPIMAALLGAFQAAWPQTCPFDELLACGKNGQQSDEDHRAAVIEALRQLLCMDVLEVRLEAVAFGGDAKSRPALIAGALPLLLAQETSAAGVGLYNYWHKSVDVKTDEAARFLVPLLDGKHTIADLRIALRDALGTGKLKANGVSKVGQRNLDPLAQAMLTTILDALQSVALLK
jgi:methyltransferase-like protein